MWTSNLCQILEQRVNTSLGSLIHCDRTRFIPLGQVSDLRKVLHLKHLTRQRHRELMLLSLDIERAFDSLSWPYPMFVFQKWGFGPSFQAWVSTLYSSSSASVCYCGFQSQPFHISRGSRQGCPLSPVLFAVAMEPLALYIH